MTRSNCKMKIANCKLKVEDRTWSFNLQFAICNLQSFCQRYFDIGGHAGAEDAFGIIDADLHAEDLVPAFIDALNIARRELADGRTLDDNALEDFPGMGIDGDFNFFADRDESELRLRHENLDPQIVHAKQAHHRL